MTDAANGNVLEVRLRRAERQKLKRGLRSKEWKPRERVRARILLLSDEGWDRESIATATGSSTSTIWRVRRRYRDRGLEGALVEAARPGAPGKLTKVDEQRVAALACTDPPPGFARWSVRLLHEEATKRKIVSGVSRERIRIVLRDHGLKPWQEKNVVHS